MQCFVNNPIIFTHKLKMVRISSFNLIWHIEVNGKFVLPFPINKTLTFPINDKLIKYNDLQ
jgi:hypothetical protein